jgi:hypothetical protein
MAYFKTVQYCTEVDPVKAYAEQYLDRGHYEKNQ